MHSLPSFVFDIRIYQWTSVVCLVLLVVIIPFSIIDPEDAVRDVIRSYFYTIINDMNLGRAVYYTTGQLRNNLSHVQNRLEEAIERTGYSGSIRNIDIQILDLRDYYARANVKVTANQSFLYASYLTVERIFDVELTRVDNEWKVMSAIQQRMEYKLWE